MTNPEIRSKAMNTIRQRNAAANSEQQRRESEIYTRIPEVEALDAEMRQDAARISTEIFRSGSSGENVLLKIRAENLERQAKKAELLVANGYPMDYLEYHYTCPKCKDTGYIGATPCSCLTDLMKRYQVEELSSMLDMKNAEFDNFNLELYPDTINPEELDCDTPRSVAEGIYDYSTEYARHFAGAKDSILITGGTGLGKTMISSCIAKEVARSGFSVVYDTAVSVFSAFEREHFVRDEDSAKSVQRFLECDLLIVDDLGTELTTAFTQSALYTIVNTRLMSGKKTIINTNLSLGELKKRYNPQIISRLDGEFHYMHFIGNDIRVKLRAQYD